MFIDVTRYGGIRVMRLAIAAIAYLDRVDQGTAVHLIGGETIRINEDAEMLEERIADAAPKIALVGHAGTEGPAIADQHPAAPSKRSRGR